MDILILGGTGAMGEPLVRKLAKNNRVYVTTRKNRVSEHNITYITCDAHNLNSIQNICSVNHFSAIIDFMVYDQKEFEERYLYFLSVTDQYVFISSARVYANSNIIYETSPRLLDESNDQKFLKTSEYSLKKAREENLLINSGKLNWTIIRPYITYNTNRLQLGTLEKEYWLRRALLGKTIVLTQNTYQSSTTLTYGGDVSNAIAEVIGNEKCIGQIFHIVNEESLKWSDILEIYSDTFEKVKGHRPKVKILGDYRGLALVLGNQYQMKYDRFYNRKFDSSKIVKYTEKSITYRNMKTGLSECLTEYLVQEKDDMYTDWRYEGYADKQTGDKTKLSDIHGKSNKIKYFLWRYFPSSLMLYLRQFKKW